MSNATDERDYIVAGFADLRERLSADARPDPAAARPAPSWGEIASAYSADPSRMARLMGIANRHREASTPMDDMPAREAAE